MLLTRKKKQQNKRLFSKLHDSDADFLIGQNNREVQALSGTNMVDKTKSSSNINCSFQVNSPQVRMQILEENFVSEVRSELDSVMTTFETIVQDAVLTSMENMMIPRLELLMKSANAPSGRSVDGNLMEPDQRDLSGDVEGLQMSASSRKSSLTDLNWIDETRG